MGAHAESVEQLGKAAFICREERHRFWDDPTFRVKIPTRHARGKVVEYMRQGTCPVCETHVTLFFIVNWTHRWERRDPDRSARYRYPKVEDGHEPYLLPLRRDDGSEPTPTRDELRFMRSMMDGSLG